MNLESAGITGILVAVVIGLIELAKILARRFGSGVKAITRNGSRPVSQLDCLKTQNALKKSIDEKFDTFRGDLKETLDGISKGMTSSVRRHEDFFHKEDSGISRRPPSDP
ncbi:MAG: hypothetical protein ACYTEQ_20770 [Planctomycetota bacterium]|jgi:hypothetical protein